MFRQAFQLSAVALLSISSAACVMAPQQPTAEPPASAPPNPSYAASAPPSTEPEAQSPAPASDSPELASDAPAESGGYVPEGKVWKEVPLEQCLPAYRKCIESIPPDARGNLGLSYEHHLAGIGLMEQGKLDATAAHKQCNGMMFMLQQGGKC